jgi:hypothetical protein
MQPLYWGFCCVYRFRGAVGVFSCRRHGRRVHKLRIVISDRPSESNLNTTAPQTLALAPEAIRVARSRRQNPTMIYFSLINLPGSLINSLEALYNRSGSVFNRFCWPLIKGKFKINKHSEEARAPQTNGPRDVPRCGALSLL